MKKSILLLSAAVVLFTSIIHAGAKIIGGPITNPANGHVYYLLAPNSWTASEAEAENLDGTLATIRTAAEQEWVFSTFGNYSGTNHPLWIGLRRTWPNGPLVWVTGEKIDYANWSAGNPDNAGGSENFVEMYPPDDPGRPGSWNDAMDNSFVRGVQPCGVVEVMGKTNPQSLTDTEKSLIGTWYELGDSNRPCWIAGTEKMLFVINHDRSTSRFISTSEGAFFAVNWEVHADVIKDKMLWSKGNWWSRKPVDYK